MYPHFIRSVSYTHLDVYKRQVFGGTVNGTGSLTVRADGVGRDTVLSGIIRLVEEAQSSKAPIQKLADKVSAIFVPAVIGAALLTFVLTLVFMRGADGMTEAISRAVAVLVIACPCSLGLATPTALMVGTGRAATMGEMCIRDRLSGKPPKSAMTARCTRG